MKIASVGDVTKFSVNKFQIGITLYNIKHVFECYFGQLGYKFEIADLVNSDYLGKRKNQNNGKPIGTVDSVVDLVLNVKSSTSSNLIND